MENEEQTEDKWTLLASLLPDGVDLEPVDENEAEVTWDGNSITVRNEGNDYEVNGRKIHFEDDYFEVINTIIIPYILQELDGNERF